MRTWFHALAMCQSMFCAIPFPWRIWDEEARDKMLLFLPVVGLEIGAIWAALAWLANLLNLSGMVTALILCMWPFLATGYIHLDGYMDVTDAIKSCRSLERRREILKDSHVGSFAVISFCLLLLTQFALFASTDGDYRVLILVPAISRCCSAMAVRGLKPMSTSQYAEQQKSKCHIAVLAVMLAVFLAGGFGFCGKYGFVAVGCLMGYSFALRKAYRSLQGMNGDISGYALTIGELCAVAVLALI